jgi:serine/threonine protein kinase/Flp pilus assembly protein TadD
MDLPNDESTLQWGTPKAPMEGHELVPGSWVGRFQVESELGQGGMGAVYRVWDPILERSVALKSIRLREDGPVNALDRFRREAMALAQVNHPHVCQVHDWVEWEGGAYIAMELVEGATLADAAATMDDRAKFLALRDVARALEAAHAKGIVHRDLKPRNVMVDGQGRVKVLDFGLARLMSDRTEAAQEGAGTPPGWDPEEDRTFLAPDAPDPDSATHLGSGATSEVSGSLTRAGSFMGSPAYASPEQIQGLQVGPPSDIFSLGVMAWELLLGDSPFPGKGRERMAATMTGRRNSLRGRKISRKLADLLKSLLAQDPARRPTAQKAAAALDSLAAPFRLEPWIAASAVVLASSLAVAYGLTHRSIIADLGQNRPPRLAVLPIQNGTGEPALGAVVEVGLTELLSRALRDCPRLAVLDADEVTRAYSSLHLAAAQGLMPVNRAQLGRALGAALLLHGTVAPDPATHQQMFTFTLAEPSGRVRFAGSIPAPPGQFTPFSVAAPAVSQVLAKVDPLHTTYLHEAPASPEVYARYADGKAMMLKGDFKGGEEPLREAAFGAPDFAQAVAAYASCLRRLGRDTAPGVANWALMAARATGDRWAVARALGVKAFLAKDSGSLEEAERLRTASMTLAEALHDADGMAVDSNHLGLIAWERGRMDQARGYFRQSLEWSRSSGDQFNIALAQNNLGNLALRQGDWAGAATLYRSNYAIQQEIGNRWGAGLALNNLGVVSINARDFPAAEDHLTRSLALRTEVGDRAGQSTCLRNLGILALLRLLPAKAEAFQRQSIQVAQEAGLRIIEAESWFCLGELQRQQQRFKPAMEAYMKAQGLLAEGVTPAIKAAATAGLAECEVRIPAPRVKDAIARLTSVQRLAPDSPYLHRALAWVRHQEGRNEEALQELEAAQRESQRQAPEILDELAAVRKRFLGGP